MLTSTPPANSADVYTWISTFINLEKGLGQFKLSLDGMLALAEAAGNPERCAPSFHMAGSKGKGSVTGMIAAILGASGIKTALYSSPHVSDFRERVSLWNGFFDEETYIHAGRELIALVEKLAFNNKTPDNKDENSFFELITLWFFLCVRMARCGAMAVETGMGGRLDATNILDPLVSVITLIELEHTEYLGNTIAAIAGEKAGIIKPGRPLVLAEQTPEALEVFREQAFHKKSPLLYFPDCAEVNDVIINREGTSFTLVLKSQLANNGTLSGLFVPIPGEVQAKNAGLAILAVKTAYPHIQEEVIREGLAHFSLPARFERISDKPPFIIDGAHTARSIELCLKTFTSLYGNGGILVFGCMEGKDVLSMAGLCVPFFSRVIITTPGTFKKSNPNEVYAAFVGEAGKLSKKPEILFLPDTGEAIDKAVSLALETGLPILGTGSFYLAGEIRKRSHTKTQRP